MTLVPLRVSVDGHDYRDLEEISTAEVYRLLRQKVAVRTASPGPGEFAKAYTAAAGPVLVLTEGAGISGINNAAHIAAEMVDGRRIRIVDTGTAAGGLRLLVEEAARLAAGGASLEEVAARVEAVAPRVEVAGMLESVEYLARSGRVPEVAHWGTSLLRVRLVVRFKRGGNGSLASLARSRLRGVRELHSIAMRDARRQGSGPCGEGVMCSVFHGDAPELAQELLDLLRRDMPSADLSMSEVTAAMVVHTGPGLVGHALYVDPSR